MTSRAGFHDLTAIYREVRRTSSTVVRLHAGIGVANGFLYLDHAESLALHMLVHVLLLAAAMGAPSRTPSRTPITCTLANGDRLSGTVVSLTRFSVRMAHPALGIVTLSRRVIAACESPDPRVRRWLGRLALGPLDPMAGATVVAVVPMSRVEIAIPRRVRRISLARLRRGPPRMPVPLPPAVVSHVGWKRTLGTTYALSRGNANTSDVGFSGGVARRAERSQIALHATRQVGSRDGTATRNFFSADVRYDLALTPGDSASSDRPSFFSEAIYEQDPLAKIRRRAVQNTGLSVPLARDPTDNLALEIGTGVTHEVPSDAQSYTRVGGLVRLAARQQFGGAEAKQQIAAFPDLTGPAGHYRLNGDVDVSAPLTKGVLLKVGITNRYDTQPQPGVRRNDTVIQSGVGVEF